MMSLLAHRYCNRQILLPVTVIDDGAKNYYFLFHIVICGEIQKQNLCFPNQIVFFCLPADWSGWKSSSQERGSVCTPTCWQANVCGTLHRVFASSELVTISGGSFLIPTPHAFTTTTPPPSVQCGTGLRAVTSFLLPSCRLWSNRLMPPSHVLQVEEEGECRLIIAQDATVGSAEREAPPPPWIRSFLKNRATERKQTGRIKPSFTHALCIWTYPE